MKVTHDLCEVAHLFKVNMVNNNIVSDILDFYKGLKIGEGVLMKALVVVSYKNETMDENGERVVEVTIHPEMENKTFQFKTYEFRAVTMSVHRSEILMKKAVTLWQESITEAKGVQNAIPRTESAEVV